MSLLALLACGGDPPSAGLDSVAPVDDAVSSLAPLAAPRLLRRMSIDLRGSLPSVEELNRVEGDPSAVEELVETYLSDDRLEAQVVRMFGERWLTRVDTVHIPAADYGLPDSDDTAFARAAGEEPLRLVARVAVEDRPWTDIVTTDTTMANELLREVWPLAGEGAGWVPARWTDGRPAAGVLASNGMWWRYKTTPFNFNRTRAAAATRLLLCEDLFARPVSFSSTTSVFDEEGTANAVRNEPGCTTCHAALDPLAASFFGFWWYDMYDVLDVSSYHPEREPLGEQFLGYPAAYFGQPTHGLDEVGAEMARDPRFSRCAVQTFAGALWRREVDPVADYTRITAARDAMIAGGMTFRAAARAILAGDVYRAGEVLPDAVEGREPTRRLVAGEQLADVLASVAGFRWTSGTTDLLRNDATGFRSMVGGVDGIEVTHVQGSPSVAYAGVTREAALLAASAVVEHDLVAGTEPRLVLTLAPDTSPDAAAFREALAQARWQLLSVRATEAEIDEDVALWRALVASGASSTNAWTGVLAALLRDPRFVGY